VRLIAKGNYLFTNTRASISDAMSENNCEDDFGGSDDDFLGFYDEYIILKIRVRLMGRCVLQARKYGNCQNMHDTSNIKFAIKCSTPFPPRYQRLNGMLSLFMDAQTALYYTVGQCWENIKKLSNIFTSTMHLISCLHTQEKQHKVKPFYTLPQQHAAALFFLQTASDYELCKPVYSLHKMCFLLQFKGFQRILQFFSCTNSAQWKLMLHFCTMLVAVCPSHKWMQSKWLTKYSRMTDTSTNHNSLLLKIKFWNQ
jgi:hypothetical protein